VAADCRVWGDSGCQKGAGEMIQPVLKYPGAKWSIVKRILGVYAWSMDGKVVNLLFKND